MANLLYQSLQPGLDEDLFGGPDAAAFAAAAAAGLNSADDLLPYSTSELNAPEYSTDEFRMFQFKVARCSKRYVHDWRACPFAHPTENARRRDPRLVKYIPAPCPEYKKGICLRGDSCTYSHGVYECWLHPAKYRTQLCKEGPNCRRPVCFFAHSVLDLRQPTHTFESQAPEQEMAAAILAVQQQHQQQQVAAAVAAVARASMDGGAAAPSASSFARLSTDEVLNNLQDNRASSDAQGAAASVAAILAAGAGGAPSPALPPASTSPPTRADTLTRASSKAGSAGSGGSQGNSPDRAGSPNTPSQTAGLSDLPAARSAEVGTVSDAAAAMAVLTQQQQQAAVAQAAAAQAAAALARLSMDAAAGGRASLDAQAAAATTQAMLAAGGGAALPPRMSLDSLLATRQQQGGWAPPAPTTTTAAAALAAATSALPLNEQPFPSGNAPRMSNAVARKLGLAPQRTSLDARLSKLRSGGATPPRTSLDGILHALQHNSARSSLDQQQALLQQAMNSQQQQLAMAGLNGMAVNGYGAGMNGYGAPPAGYGHGHGHGHGMPGPGSAPDMQLHPALLSLVAAQMQQAPQPQMSAGMPGMPPAGVPQGMHSGLGSQHNSDVGVAALMESLNGWQLGGGSSAAASLSQRASMDSMAGMAGVPGVPGGPGPAPGAYYDAKGIWAAASSQEAINNSAGADS